MDVCIDEPLIQIKNISVTFGFRVSGIPKEDELHAMKDIFVVIMLIDKSLLIIIS